MVSSRLRLPRWHEVLLTAVALITVAMVSYPVLSVVIRSVSEDAIGSNLTLRWLIALFDAGRSREALVNTIIYALGSSVLSMALGVGLAVASMRTDIPGRRLIGLLALIPILVPPFILVIGWVAIADPNAGLLNLLVSGVVGSKTTLVNINGMLGIIWITGLFLTPYVYLIMAASLSRGDPAVEEAARVSGATRWRLLTTIILPLQRPALLSAFLLVQIMSAGDFIIPATVGLKARIYLLPSLIWQNSNSFPPRPGLAAAQALLLLAVSLICVFIQRRSLAGGRQFTLVGGKGATAAPIRLGRLRYVFGGVALTLALCASLLPLMAVTAMAFLKYWSPNALTWDNVTLANFEYILFKYPQVWPSARNSLFLGVLGATLCVALAIALAWYILRMRGALSGLVDYASVLPLGIPGIALGLGILSAWIAVPGGLYGTLWILLLAYVTAHFPVAMQFVASALRAIHTDLEAASRICGHTWFDTLHRIVIPLMRPALIGSWLLIYIVILREISLIILLYNPSTIVLSVGLMDVWANGFYPELAVYSLLLLVLGLVPIAILWKFAELRHA